MKRQVRDTQAGRSAHDCTTCGRTIPVGDPKWELTTVDTTQHRAWSEYHCRSCLRRRPR